MTTTDTLAVGDRISIIGIRGGANQHDGPFVLNATVEGVDGAIVHARLDRDGAVVDLDAGRGDVWMERDPALDIEQSLDEDEQRRAVEWFTARNPHWDGANLSDILAALVDVDAYLELVEPLFDDGVFSSVVEDDGSRTWGRLASYAAYAAVLLGADTVDRVGTQAYELLCRVGSGSPARRFVLGM